MDTDKIQAIFVRHMEDFQKEVGAINATPETLEKIRRAIEPVLDRDQKTEGFGIKLARHWEAFMPTLLAATNSAEKQQELCAAVSKMLLEQIQVFNRILTRDLPTG